MCVGGLVYYWAGCLLWSGACLRVCSSLVRGLHFFCGQSRHPCRVVWSTFEQGGFYLWLVLRRLLSPLRSFEVLSLLAGEIGVSLGYTLFCAMNASLLFLVMAWPGCVEGLF